MSIRSFNPVRAIVLRLRPPVPVPASQLRLLFLVGVALLIEAYDVNIYGFAIPQIQRSLGIAEADVGRVIAVFRLGVVPALALAYLADVFGRRAMLIVTVAGMTAATVWTAFAQDVTQFVISQTLARVCGYAESMLCFVVVAEEFDERARGWAIGILGALGALGAGSAALIFGFVTLLPFGWRALYALGAVPLLWLLWARRSLPETRRFADRHRASGRYVAPLLNLVRAYPTRLLLMIAVTAPFSFVAAPAVLLIPKYLQSTQGWAPWQLTALVLVAGPIALAGSVTSGWLSDRIGRRLTLFVALVVGMISLASLYTWATGPALVLLWILAIAADLATAIMIGALTAELFPTSYRSFAAGVRFLFAILAGAAGFLVEGNLFERVGSHGEAIVWMLLVAPIALIPIWFLPEPASKSLDDIAPELTP
jgi:putative MFS transporter